MSIPSAADFPDLVPTLTGPDPRTQAPGGIVLRAATEADIPASVEQSRDPETIRYTTVPTPPGGYSEADARQFLGVIADGWRTGTSLSWTIEAERAGRRQFCGTIDLRLAGDGAASVGYALHPGARGRSLMVGALRLVLDYGFDVCHLQVITWAAHVGNWPSRRAAAAAGFGFEGVSRLSLFERGRWRDGWRASITATDPRTSLLWPRQPVLTGGPAEAPVRLRPLTDQDQPRLVEAGNDPEQRRWLPSLPHPYGPAEASAFIESTRESEATLAGYTWAITEPDPGSPELLGCLSVLFDPRLAVSEIGYWVHPAHRGQQWAARATALAADWTTGRGRIPLVRCHRDHVASQRVAQAAGFTLRTPLGGYDLLTRPAAS